MEYWGNAEWILVPEAAQRSGTTVANVYLAMKRNCFITRIEHRPDSPKGRWWIEISSFDRWRAAEGRKHAAVGATHE